MEIEVNNSPDYVDPRLLAPPPRKAELTGSSMWMVRIRPFLRYVKPTLIILYVIFAIRSEIALVEVANSRTLVGATVTNSYHISSSDWMVYTYYYDDVRYEGEQAVERYRYERMQYGDKLEVYVVPKHPDISNDGQPTVLDLISHGSLELCVLLLLLAGCWLFEIQYDYRPDNRLSLAMTGLVAQATVIDQDKRKSTVHVKFMVDSRIIEADISVDAGWDCPAGTDVAVIYLPTSPDEPMLVTQLIDIVLY